MANAASASPIGGRMDPRKLEVPGRKRLEIDHGAVIREILA